MKLLLGRIESTHEALETCREAVARVLKEAGEGQSTEHRDAQIVRSLPGAGRYMTAAMLGEARRAIRDRDYQSLRAAFGVSPVTWRSGKSRPLVHMRRSVNNRLRKALHMAMLNLIRYDAVWGERYRAVRERGKNQNHAIRIVGDQMLRVLIGMLKAGTTYEEERLLRAA